MKLQYKSKKWDKEIVERGKIIEQIKLANDGKASEELNIRNIIWQYLEPETFPYPKSKSSRDEGEVLDLIALNYMTWACNDYLFGQTSDECIGHIYQSVLAYSKSYALWKSGIIPNNCSIVYNRQRGRDIERICFEAVVINELELFESYADGIGAELIKAFYHQDYKKASILLEKLPDSKEMYIKNVSRMSYYFEYIFMKDLYTSILEKNEAQFNSALEERIRYVRKGYIMEIDFVSVSMIKFAKAVGINCNVNVVEVPHFLLEEKLVIDKQKYCLPNLAKNHS